jgi:integrase
MENTQSSQLAYLSPWKDAMRYGLMAGRPYSESCIHTYSLYVRQFLEEYGEVSLVNFKKAMLTIPITQFAKRLKLYEALNCFARYLMEEQVMDAAYITDVKRFKPKRHLPPKKTTVDQSGLEKLVAVTQNPLDRLIVILLSQTGLRVTEAASLLISDLDLERKVLTVRLAKWGKTRRVGLTDVTVEAIRAYLSVRPESNLPQLFINRDKNPMTRYGLRVRLEKLGKLTDVPVTPHALRRAFVTLNANKGRPLVMLQIACGHSDISTTRSYCMTSEEETVQAMQGW